MDWKLVQYCKEELSLPNLLNERDKYQVSDRRPIKVFCPFHDDVNKKSATVYPQSNELYCFTNKKVFGPYDILSDLDGLDDGEIQEYVGYDPEKFEFDVQEQVSEQDIANLQKIKYDMVKSSPNEHIGKLLNQVVKSDNILKVM